MKAKGPTDARIGAAFKQFFEAMKDGPPFLKTDLPDVEVVLSATTGLDHLLRIAISTTFRTVVSATHLSGIFEATGPLSTFDAKIRVAAALGILPGDSRHDLDLIRAIRNRFAHSVLLRTFSDADIKVRCSQLKMPATAVKPKRLYEPRDQFVESCRRLHEFLISGICFSIVVTEFISLHKQELVKPAGMLAEEFIKMAGLVQEHLQQAVAQPLRQSLPRHAKKTKARQPHTPRVR